MSRYLTPSKIGLLSLIALYAESVIPIASSIPVLSFLVSHALPSQGKPILRNNDTSAVFAISLDDFRKATQVHASGIPGRTVWDLLLKRLWEVNSFDALHGFFDSLTLLLPNSRRDLDGDVRTSLDVGSQRIRLSRTSPLGTFVRRARLEFTRLQLHDGIALWKSFVSYRHVTLVQWRRRNAAATSASFDINLSENPVGTSSKEYQILYGDLDPGI